jgi:subtilisin family serine protease
MNKRELLAINVNQESLGRARAKGFTITESVDLSHLGFSMVRVLAPRGWDAKKSQDWLKQELPNDRFEFNQTYRHYRPNTASDGDSEPPGRPGPFDGSQACGDRCYATAAINWKPTLGDCANKVHVGVIDTAVDSDLFTGRNVQYANAAPPGQPKATSWHGTGVLSLLSGTSRSDTPGLIPGAHFILADAFAADQDGQPVSDTASVLKALDLLTAFEVQVVNMSLSGPHDEMVKSAIERLTKSGIVFVAAAGNGGPTAPRAYPAAYRQVIAVTAVNKHLNGYPYANRGDYIDVAAPGVRIWTAVSKEKHDYLSGTSFATPYVTAIVAALANQGLTTKEAILDRLDVKDLGPPGRDPIFGRGLVLAPSSCNPAPVRPPVVVTTAPWTVVQSTRSP